MGRNPRPETQIREIVLSSALRHLVERRGFDQIENVRKRAAKPFRCLVMNFKRRRRRHVLDIAANIAKLPELLRRSSLKCSPKHFRFSSNFGHIASPAILT